MNNKFLKTRVLLVFILSIIIGFTSCQKEDTVEPEKHHHHDEPAIAELILVPGHLHGAHGFHQNGLIKGMKYLKQIQKIKLKNTDNGWVPTEESAKQFNVLSTEAAKKAEEGAAVYGLFINYFAEDGDTLTQEFIENEKDKLHQHFFIPTNVKATFDGVTAAADNDAFGLFNYVYCDTDPWNKTMHGKEAKLIGDKNPFGHKGYFWFKKARKQFTLNINLMHASKSKFDETGKASPYCKPSNEQLQTNHWDIKLQIPVVVYADSYEFLENDYDLSLSEKELKAELEKAGNENDKKYVESVMKAFNISIKEALTEIDLIISGDTDPESGNIWF